MMTEVQSPHVSDDLPRLLTGDATRDEAMSAADHLRTCPDCQDELVSAVVAHASLASANRFAAQVFAPEPEDEPPPVRAHPSGRHATAGEAAPEAPQLPDLSDLFAQLRAEASLSTAPAPAAAPTATPVPTPTATAARPSHRRRWIAAGVAAAVIAGGGIAVGVVASNTSTSSGRSVALAPIDVGRHPAKMTIAGSTLKIDATKLPKPAAASVYEVWLVDRAGKNLAAIGTLGSDNTATLTVAPQVRSNFKYVQVSVQKSSDLTFSNISVLRGDIS
jgi:hypothetical protein